MTIQIKNIGAIKDSGIISLKPVMLLLGPQGVGKSTLMKILCHCRWIEKEIMREDGKLNYYSHYGRFLKGLKQFHKLNDSFFTKESSILYEGEGISIHWQAGSSKSLSTSNAKILRRKDFSKLRHNPKISFLPAERNLISLTDNIDKNYKANARTSLFNLLLELGESRSSYSKEAPLRLAIAPHLSYFSEDGEDFIIDANAKKIISPFYAASGIQSSYPIELISAYLESQIGEMPNVSISDLSLLKISLISAMEQGKDEDIEAWRKSIRALQRQLQYSSAQIYIEEPEQNLFPESQRRLMISLLHWLNRCRAQEHKIGYSSPRSMLMITTHSPYLITVVNALMSIYRTRKDIQDEKPTSSTDICMERLQQVAQKYDLDLDLSPDDFAAYFISEDGAISPLIDPEFAMVSGVELDSVSDWAENIINEVYSAGYEPEAKEDYDILSEPF
jgi:hypothetical protein